MTEVIFNHFVIPCNQVEVCIIHRVEVSGLLAPILWMTMRRALKKGMPQAIKRLALLAECKCHNIS